MRIFCLTTMLAVVLAGFSGGLTAGELQLWPVDIHEKIFADTTPQAIGPVTFHAARNEYESGQFGLFAADGAENLTLTASVLMHENGTATLPAETVRLRPIRTVTVTKNTQGAEKTVVRTAPFECPDILTEDETVTLAPNESKGVWVTLFIPADALSGRYTGTITAASDTLKAEIPIQLDVFSFTLPSQRHLWVTNWFSLGHFAKVHNVDLYSEEFWPILERYFLNMAEHRQNVVLTPWVPDNSFVKATRQSDGTWEVDFSLLERYLSLAEKSGVAERIELGHCGGVNRQTHEVDFSHAAVYDEERQEVVHLPADEWLCPVLGELEKWLIATGRIERAMIHIADEPYQPDMKSWRAASDRVHAAAPQIKRIDAIESLNFAGKLEIWVPKLTHYHHWKKYFDSMRTDGVEMWYYICCHPYGNHFPNRFMDLPGTRIRSIHWINYTEDLCGYLHWGYSFWQGDPFGPPYEIYGPGDTHAIYPGPLDSVRWEIERESCEDYEYFRLLEELAQETASRSGADLWWFDAKCRGMEIARRAVHAMDCIETDPKIFADARRDLAGEIASLNEGFPLIVRTFPEENATLVTGPPLNELYGLTVPGATVSIDGWHLYYPGGDSGESTGDISRDPDFHLGVTVNPDGTFHHYEMRGCAYLMKITASFDEKTVSTFRRFNVK